jgi:hypothetical protein
MKNKAPANKCYLCGVPSFILYWRQLRGKGRLICDRCEDRLREIAKVGDECDCCRARTYPGECQKCVDNKKG